MKTAPTGSKTARIARLALAGVVVSSGVSPAWASKRTPAPIVYASGTSEYPAGKPQYIEPARAPDTETRKKKRIEFRYPDQPEMVYGGKTARRAEQAAPMAFSSSAAAIDPAAARQYAAVPAARPDPALTAGSFDARAAAARADAQRELQGGAAVVSESLKPVAAAPVLQPAVLRPAAPAVIASVVGDTSPVFDETGIGIVYGEEFNGLPTSNGEMFDAAALTAAHPSLPLPSLVQVTNLDTGRDVVVRVNDRGPFEDGAMIQVSQRAAMDLGMTGAGRANLRLRYLGTAPKAAMAASQSTLSTPAVASQPLSAASIPAPQPYLSNISYNPQSPSPAPMPAAGAGEYYVQLGSFSDIANAQALAGRIPAGMPVSIQPARVNNADYFRVRLGPVLSQYDADQLSLRAQSYGLERGRVVAER
ncbi:MAG: septal ring lytic transglycosylase RlpA family protein [Hyphomonas sp.]|nr:septal ring lytic transglycosylase RlpA family protein [Hyphomonas sp.]